MAYLPKKPGEEDDDFYAQTGGANGPAFTGGSPFASGGTSRARGTGGMSSFTNLQSYIDANPSDPQSANLITEQATKPVASNRSAMENYGTDFRQKADAAGAAGDMSSQMNPLLWAGVTDASKASLAPKNYQSPGGYGFNLGQDLTDIEGNLGDTEKFRAYRDTVYRQQTPVSWTKGMDALQRQLDTNNPAIDQARQNALAEIASLRGDAGTAKADAESYANQKKGEFDTAQTNWKNFLDSQAGLANQYGHERLTAYQNPNATELERRSIPGELEMINEKMRILGEILGKNFGKISIPDGINLPYGQQPPPIGRSQI